ncbi:hypothetical protein Tco_0031873 [Tanacetum coccineum]
MSSASSTVTYTSVYTDSEPGRVFLGADEEPSDGGPPRVIIYGYDGLPMQPIDPPSPDYVPGPEHPPSPIYFPYVPELEYPEYLAPSDDEVPIEDQPLPDDASPVALSLDYVSDSDLEEDPKEDSEKDHADYPADGGDGDDEPSDDDDDDDTDDEDEETFEDEGDDEEEEEHLALADSSAIPVVDHVPSAGDTEAFETDEAAGIWMITAAVSPPLLLPSTSHRTDIPEAEMPPQNAARQPGPTLEADTWDEIVEAMLEVAPTTLEGVDQRVTKLDTTVRDRPYHRHTAQALDREAIYGRLAWTSSEERSAAIEAHVRTLEEQVATLIAQTTSL